MDGKRIRIIVVEDQPILRSEIVSNLCAEGFETFGAKDGTELCGGQVISDTSIGFVSAIFRSKTEGGRLPRTECRRSLL